MTCSYKLGYMKVLSLISWLVVDGGRQVFWARHRLVSHVPLGDTNTTAEY